jgi:uncharacterized protein
MAESRAPAFAPTHVSAVCRDVPNSAVRRKAAAESHRRYLESILDRLLLAGPLYSGDGRTVVGSLFVYKTTNIEDARKLLEADPYHQAGFWNSIEIHPFVPAAGDCVGGKIW